MIAAVLATLGLALDSTAVVIGAMLIAPLMRPIVDLAMGLATGSAPLVLRAGFRSLASVLVVTLTAVACAAVLTYISTSWLVWTVLAILMLARFGRHHPRTFDEDVPLDSLRMRLAVFAVVMFVLCFTAAPIEPLQLLR